MKKFFITGMTSFLIMFVLCVVFASFTTANTAGSAGRSASDRIEVKQDSSALVPIEEIPILAWCGVQEHTVERYRELKECGIDYNFTSHSNVENMALAMDTANTTGVKILLHCPELETETEKVVNRFKEHPALAGYHLKDEPWGTDFSYLDNLARKIQAVDNRHFCYVNLFPNYVSSDALLPATTYREHVQLFLQEVPVQFLSFDHYPISANNSGVHSLNNKWYENLEIISDEARKAEKPFWAFAATTSFWTIPIPTLIDLRIQVYSNLAYGAQGIQYFTYWTPPPSYPEGFHDGPIDHTGQKTPTWYIVQQMNKEIKALSKVFLGAKVIKVEHIVINASGKDGELPVGTTRFDFANRPAEAKKIIKKFTIPKNTNAIVSFLKNGNRAYMVIVNRNLEGGDNVTFTITGGAGLQLIKKDGKAVNAFFQRRKQTVTPGDVLIYGWDI